MEEEFRFNFPEIPYQRLDSDTTSTRGAHRRIIESFARGESRVMIGTQMAAKAFDFPGLTFAGLVNADSVLSLPDFRSAEKTFQLVLQVAGRVGRGTRPGRVVVQTYQPHHYALVAGSRHDFTAFAEQELAFREALSYPPFSRLVLVVGEGPIEDRLRKGLGDLREVLEALDLPAGSVQVLGPSPAPILKIRKNFRWQLLIKLLGGKAVWVPTKECLAACRAPRGSVLKIDVDPISLL